MSTIWLWGMWGCCKTIFKCQMQCQFLYSEISYAFAVWVDRVRNTIKSDDVKNVSHRMEKVEKSTQISLKSLGSKCVACFTLLLLEG